MPIFRLSDFPKWYKYLCYSWALWITSEFILMRHKHLGPQNGSWSCQNDQPCGQRIGALSHVITAYPPEKGEWVHLRGQWVNQLCLHNETPIKPLDTKAEESFLVGEHINVLGGWCTLILLGQGIEARSSVWGAPRPCPIVSVHLAGLDLYPF